MKRLTILLGLSMLTSTACGGGGGKSSDNAPKKASSNSALTLKHSACRTEVPANLTGIRTAQEAYNAEFDQYVSIPQNPESLSGNSPVDWPQSAGFEQIGWNPDGKVRGAYSVTTTRMDFKITGKIDCDGDGVPAIYTATKSIKAQRSTAENVY